MVEKRRGHQLQPDSLQGRIRQFFTDNPDEELGYSDIAIKMGCTPVQAARAVVGLKRMKLVETMFVVRRKRGGAA
jgi:hypothetical protein